MPVIYTHNDEDEATQVFVVEVSTGKTVGTFGLNPALPSNADPESIRLDRKGGGILYLADIGDNDLDRPAFPSSSGIALYGLPEPGPGNHGVLKCKRYPVSYPGGVRKNSESLAINPINGQKYIISKEKSGSVLYRLPMPLVANANNAMVGIRTLIEAPLATDAAFTLNGQWLLVRCQGKQNVIVFNHLTWKKDGEIKCPQQAKGESIAMEPGGKSFLIGSEGRGGNNKGSPIYRIVIPTKYRGNSLPAPSSPTKNPTKPGDLKPAQIMDLRFAKLTLPTGTKGDPDEILQPKLRTYEHPKYFFDSNGRVVFTCPYGGVTTSGSVNPRTEIREMWKNGQYDEAAWNSARGNNRLTLIDVSVNHVGAVERQVTFGQLHDGGDDRVMLRYEGVDDDSGDIWADFGLGKGQGASSTKIVSGYQLGKVIDKIAILTNSSGFRVLVNDVSKAFTAKTATGCYFKWGCYPQKSSAEARSDFAQVRIRHAVVNHNS